MRVDSIRFSSGAKPGAQSLAFSPHRLTLLIGPNNGGKSRALREIASELSSTTFRELKVISEVIASDTSEDELRSKLSYIVDKKMARDPSDIDFVMIRANGSRSAFNIRIFNDMLHTNLYEADQKSSYFKTILQHFVLNLSGGGRLELTNPVPAEPVGTMPNSTLSRIYNDDAKRSLLSDIVFRGFGQRLTINPTVLPQMQYHLSPLPSLKNEEKTLDASALAFFKDGMPLHEASDGTRAFLGMISEVIAGVHDVVLIDEPEAFLHPSLQLLLGRHLAVQASDQRQVFAATHSPHFLLGCVLSGLPVDVVRLTYKSGVATARHLESSRLRTLMTDPLFRSVGASTALFYECAVVCEGDADRAFYDEINRRLSVSLDYAMQHATFLNAHNKQTVVNIVRPLRDIGIPAAFILDIDWLKEDGQVWDRYFNAMGAPLGLKDGLAATRRTVRAYLQNASPEYKTKGGVGLLTGDELATANAFFDQAEEYGLFTVRTGELESWLPALDAERAKSKWLASMFERLGSDADAPGYVNAGSDDVWAFLGRIAAWAQNPERSGM